MPFDNIDFATLRFIWYAILALIAALAFLGRTELLVRIATALLFSGYLWMIAEHTDSNIGIGPWLTRLGCTLLLIFIVQEKAFKKRVKESNR